MFLTCRSTTQNKIMHEGQEYDHDFQGLNPKSKGAEEMGPTMFIPQLDCVIGCWL